MNIAEDVEGRIHAENPAKFNTNLLVRMSRKVL